MPGMVVMVLLDIMVLEEPVQMAVTVEMPEQLVRVAQLMPVVLPDITPPAGRLSIRILPVMLS
jgi:hypothetical protein